MIKYAKPAKKLYIAHSPRRCRYVNPKGAQPEKTRFQVIVVGAGAAGTTAAYFLARSGVDVLLLERGPYPGSKNMSGGAVYSLPTQELLDDFWKEAPIERTLVDQQYWLMTERSAVRLGFINFGFAEPPYNRCSVLRANFDRWYAAKAVEAGAELWTSCKAESILFDRNKAVGVRISGSRAGELFADIVIIAEGANRLLVERAGLAGKANPKNYNLYIKQTFYLPEHLINERLGLKGSEGAVIGLLGDNTAGLIGTGSIYTFKEHIGINSGISVKTLAQKKVRLGDLVLRLNRHPLIEPLIKGGTLVEYTARMIPEGGFNAMPQLIFDGLMITGDAGALVNGTHGINLAMYSGKFAAETAVEALHKGDYSAKVLDGYRDRLENSFVLKDMRDNRKVPQLFSQKQTLFRDYINLLNHVSNRVATVHPMSRRKKRKIIRRETLALIPAGKLITDLYKTIKVIK